MNHYAPNSMPIRFWKNFNDQLRPFNLCKLYFKWLKYKLILICYRGGQQISKMFNENSEFKRIMTRNMNIN